MVPVHIGAWIRYKIPHAGVKSLEVKEIMKKLLAGVAAGAVLSTMLMALDEKELTKKMKAAGEHMGPIRKSAQAQSMPDVATHAKAMVQALEGTETFWKDRNLPQAVKWSEDGVVAAKALAKAAEENNADGVRAAMSKLGASCKSCHDVHREKLPDGTYKIK